MDHICITNLLFRGKHGLDDVERRVEQEFLIEADLEFDAAKAGASDKLADTVDYAVIRDKVKQVIEGKSRYLIESLAEDIARKILEDKRIKSVEIIVKKTAVWDNGIPCVTIVRKNA